MNKEKNSINKVILNLIQDLQRLLGSFSNGVRRRCQIKFGMTSYVKGFTLLEILIVVIIIAVLAVIAVSAYQKAVLKSRFAALMPLAKTLVTGNEDYYLHNGRYTNDATELDIRVPSNSKAQITLGNEDQHKYVLLTREDINNNLRMYQQRSPNFPGETHCEALIDDSQANWLCRDGLKGTLVGNKYGYTVYSLSDQTVGTLKRIYNNVNGTFKDGDECHSSGGCRGTYINAKCITENGNYSCGGTGTWFTNNSVCVGNHGPSCGAGTEFDHSVCISNAKHACDNSRLKNHSICYQLKYTPGFGCIRGNVTYDETSCCAGDYCTRDRCEDKGIVAPPVSVYLND